DAEAQLAQERGAGVLDHRVQLLLVKAKSIFGQRLLYVHEPALVAGLNPNEELASSRLLRHRVHRPDRRLNCGVHIHSSSSNTQAPVSVLTTLGSRCLYSYVCRPSMPRHLLQVTSFISPEVGKSYLLLQ